MTSESEPGPDVEARWHIFPFLLGNGVSVAGNTLTLVALPWFVLDTTGSAGKTGLTGMAFALPAIISGILGGALIDRIGGRRMSVVADIVSGVSIALIPILDLTVGIAFWQLLILVFLGSMLDIPGLTARRTMLPALATRAGMRPEAMNSSFEMTDAAAIIVGPLIAGLLVAWIGAINLLLVDAGTFVVSAILIGCFTPDVRVDSGEAPVQVVAHQKVRQRWAAVWQTIIAGLRFIRHDRLLLALAITLVFTNFFNGPFFSVVMPVVVRDRYGDATLYGLLLTVFGVGSLLGGAAYGAFGHRIRGHRWSLWFVGFTSVAVIRWVIVPDVPYELLVGAMILAGLLSGPINPMLVTVRFERIPFALRGRVFASFAALASIADPLGMAATGFLIERRGLEVALIVTAVLFTVILVALPFIRSLREMDQQSNTQVREVEPVS